MICYLCKDLEVSIEKEKEEIFRRLQEKKQQLEVYEKKKQQAALSSLDQDSVMADIDQQTFPGMLLKTITNMHLFQTRNFQKKHATVTNAHMLASSFHEHEIVTNKLLSRTSYCHKDATVTLTKLRWLVFKFKFKSVEIQGEIWAPLQNQFLRKLQFHLFEDKRFFPEEMLEDQIGDGSDGEEEVDSSPASHQLASALGMNAQRIQVMKASFFADPSQLAAPFAKDSPTVDKSLFSSSLSKAGHLKSSVYPPSMPLGPMLSPKVQRSVDESRQMSQSLFGSPQIGNLKCVIKLHSLT